MARHPAIALAVALAAAGVSRAGEPGGKRPPADRQVEECVRALHADDPEARAQAVATLGSLGPRAKAAVPALVEALADDVFGDDAARALGKIGADAVPALTAALRRPERSVRVGAAAALGYAGRAARPVLPHLVRALRDPDALVQAAAGRALRRINPSPHDLVPAVRALIVGAKSDHHLAAASDVALAGRPGTGALAELLRDGDRAVRQAAAFALAERAGQDPSLDRPVRAALRHDDATVRLAAAQGLWTGGRAEAVVPLLGVALDDLDREVRLQALMTLRLIKRWSEPAVGLLVKALRDRDADVVGVALPMLGKARPEIKAALPSLAAAMQAAPQDAPDGGAPTLPAKIARATAGPLTDLLRAKDAPVRAQAARLLGGCGRAAAPAVPALRQALADRDEAVRVAAAEALAPLDPDCAGLAPLLRQALRDPAPAVREQAVRGLDRLGDGSRETVAALEGALKDGDAAVRGAAAGTLRRLGGRAEAALPALAAALRSRDAETRGHAAIGLARAGAAAVPALRKALRDRDPDVRAAAAYALGRIGKSAREAAPGLAGALKDETAYVRLAAGEALKQIDPAAAARAGVR